MGDLEDTADGAGGSPESCGGWRAGARVCVDVPEDRATGGDRSPGEPERVVEVVGGEGAEEGEEQHC